MPAITGNAAQQRNAPHSGSAGEPSRAGAPSAGLSGAAPSGSASMAPWRLTASLSPGTRASLVEEAIPGCGLGTLGSGSTLGVDWSEVTPYDSGSVGSGTMLPPAGSSAPGPESGAEDVGPVAGEHEGDSAGRGGAGEEEGDEAMADTSTKSMSEFDLGVLVSDVRHLQEDVTEIKIRLTGVENRLTGVENRLTGVENRLTSMDDRQQSNFRWLVGVVAIPLNLAIMGMLARLLGLL